MEKKQGIIDLIKESKYTQKEIAKMMQDDSVPFKPGRQNFYNFVYGKFRSTDPYVYIWMSRLLNIPLEDMIMRYSTMEEMEVIQVEPKESINPFVKVKEAW